MVDGWFFRVGSGFGSGCVVVVVVVVVVVIVAVVIVFVVMGDREKRKGGKIHVENMQYSIHKSHLPV